MWIVESDGPPSWSLDASKTGESTKCLWVGEVGLKAWPAVPSTTPTHGYFVLSPVSHASRDQDGGPSHWPQRSTSANSQKNRGLRTV